MAYLNVDELAPPGHSGRSLVESFTAAERTAACIEASSTADSYFMARPMSVPLPNPSPETKRRVRFVAIYNLLCGRGINPDTPGHLPVIQNYNDAIRWFEQCAKGTAHPTLGDDATPSVEEGAPTVSSDEPRGW